MDSRIRTEVKRRRRLNERAWRAVFDRYDAGGLTVEAFCEREGLSRSSFNRWRSRLQQPPVKVRSPMTSKAGTTPIAAPAAFLDLGPLATAAPTAAPMPSGVELRLDLGGGLSLTLVRR